MIEAKSITNLSSLPDDTYEYGLQIHNYYT